MSLLNINKSLFSVKKSEENQQQEKKTPESKITYHQYGKNLAEKMGGTSTVLPVGLQTVYREMRRRIENDEQEQNARKQPIRNAIIELEGQLKTKEDDIKNEEEELNNETKLHNEAKSELAKIKQNPEIVNKGSNSSVISFYIGLLIIILLTVYLFIFYSSAAYSAFFKLFEPNEIGIADAIFDGQALSKALKDGFTELVLILTIPVVFLGLGFLVHKFGEEKSKIKYLKLLLVFSIAFVFDTILAYEITEKIYELKRMNSFESDYEQYNFSLAFKSVNFWLIIFSGFIVYIIWGLLFDFTMKEYDNLDKISVAKKNLEDKINKHQQKCDGIKNKIKQLTGEKNTIEADMRKKKGELDTVIVWKSDVELELNNFMTGWFHYMEFKKFSQDEIVACKNVKDDFLKSFENIPLTNTENSYEKSEK